MPSAPLKTRSVGVLLHPTSLPGTNSGSGLVSTARHFIEFLYSSGCRVWQMLPLLPVNASRSPYQPLSLFAGNTDLIDDHESVQALALPNASSFDAFRRQHAEWLAPWCLYQTLRERFHRVAWQEWPNPFRDFDPHRLDMWNRMLAADIEREALAQFLFHRQWRQLRHYANSQGIALFGDLPFYPSTDSADVWSNRHLFQLDDRGYPLQTGGVPPDAFSATGQDWGTPVFDWEAMQTGGFHWWLARLRHQLELFDILRIDHFRGLESCWEIPTFGPASAGSWHPTPGKALLSKCRAQFPTANLVAEDLGTITTSVTALRRQFDLPGMRVLQFGFDGGNDNPHHPSRHEADCVIYTGTHDNDTALGWWRTLPGPARQRLLTLVRDTTDIHWQLINLALASPGVLSIIPMQDLLGLGCEARMNTPGTVGGNWQWQLSDLANLDPVAQRLRERAHVNGRLSPQSIL